MNNLLVDTIALVTVFSMPASAAHTAGFPRGFDDIPDVSRNTEANSGLVPCSNQEGCRQWSKS
jgi:hypothetical protein